MALPLSDLGHIKRSCLMESPVLQRAVRKAGIRIIPLVFIIYLVAFLDRANVAYAKLTMSADLGFSERVYGFGAGVFFIGYLILEIPGGLIVQRWGARRWMTRILVSWGICTALTSLIHTAFQFYAARFFLGLAEAGLVPGVLVYLHEWFPAQFRARALARFFIASPVALAIGGPIAGLILSVNWYGISGWRWLFVLEGIPALILAIISLFVMVDRPDQATWLTAEERDSILHILDLERQKVSITERRFTWKVFGRRDVLLLAAASFLANVGISGFFLWLPSTLHDASSLSAPAAAALSGIPFASAIVAVLLMSYSSDRSGERYLHTALPLILAAMIFPITTQYHLSFVQLLIALCLSAAAIYGFGPSYWTLPTQGLTGAGAAAAFGFLNLFGALGSFVGPSVVGTILTAKRSFSVAVIFLSACFFLAGTCILALPRRSKLTDRWWKSR